MYQITRLFDLVFFKVLFGKIACQRSVEAKLFYRNLDRAKKSYTGGVGCRVDTQLDEYGDKVVGWG